MTAFLRSLPIAFLALSGFCPASEARPEATGGVHREEAGLLRRKAADGMVFVPLMRHTLPGSGQAGKPSSARHVYSGNISFGLEKPQIFSVVFDTASGHVVVPDASCQSPACLKRQRYQLFDSPAADPINKDGGLPEWTRDEIEVTYDTGDVVGDFVRETVCVGSGTASSPPRSRGACRKLGVVVARSMPMDPFGSFGVDGIFGLGLKSLATTPMFSYLSGLAEDKGVAQFGIYLTKKDGHHGGELAMAGYNPARLKSPLGWSPVASPELGYWQVQVRSVRIGDKVLDVCRNGGCRGIVDSGISHLGVPKAYMSELSYGLSGSAQDHTDCRMANAPSLTLELEGASLTLRAEDLMYQDASPDTRLSLSKAGRAEKQNLCKPRLEPVSYPAPFAQNLFILGQPVLRRYYTAFEWQESAPRVGFALADHDEESGDDVLLLVQVTFGLEVRPC